jgi:DNA-binding XRE family transcriptional regulator
LRDATVVQDLIRTGRDLAAERVRASLRQSDVARTIGVSRQRIGQVENARRPTSPTIARYLTAVERAGAEERR